jgi:hypothetical protein
MTEIRPRKYKVTTRDFPVRVVIRARGLGKCDAFVSDVMVVRDGELVAQNPVTVVSDDQVTKSYDIKKPAQRAGCDLVQSINAFFGKTAPDSATYLVTIISSLDDEATTSIGVPTIDPGIANLTFQYR